MSVDPLRVAALIADIAATEIAARYGKLKRSEIREKSGPSDLVTEVDEATERALEKALRALLPAAHFIGEEAAARDPAIAARIGEAQAAWIVDPLDGTRNFTQGVPEFGVIVALVERGRTRMGWIHAVPVATTAIAVAGEGAWWGGEKIAVAPPAARRLRGLRSLGWLEEARATRIRAVLATGFDVEPGHCSAYAYLKLARGEVDFKISSRVHPWDHAAGALLIEETGGEVAWLDDGAAYRPAPSTDAPLLAVAAGREWKEIAGALRG